MSKVPTKRQVKFAYVLFIYILTNIIKRQVIGRYLGLYESFKAKTGRLTTIVNELRSLWNKLNFPVVSNARITVLLKFLIQQKENSRKHGKKSKMDFNNIFDVTKVGVEWLCKEDSQLYQLQVSSSGRIGYTTEKSTTENYSSFKASKNIF